MNRVFLCLVAFSICSLVAMPADAQTIAAKTVTNTATSITVTANITHVSYIDHAMLTGNDYTLSANQFDVEYKAKVFDVVYKDKVMAGLTASGNIKLVIKKAEGTYTLTSRQATYNPARNEITLTDHVQSPFGNGLLDSNPKAKTETVTSFTFGSTDQESPSFVSWTIPSEPNAVTYWQIGPVPKKELADLHAAELEVNKAKKRH